MTRISVLSNKAQGVHDRFNNDLAFYSNRVLKIKNKKGQVCPLIFNKAQIYLHKRLEKMRREIGRIRAIIVKGRQQGCTTYLQARYYHKATRSKGKNIFILSHEGETTKKIFSMTRTFYENSPPPMQPHLKSSNAKELIFDKLGSQYFVGTAGNADVGRGGTVQYFHGSEVAFWPHADEIKAGILQAVPLEDETEVIFESTANGMGNMFHKMAMDALQGVNGYELIFIPWFWQEEYTIEPDPNFERMADEEKLVRQFNLTDGQLQWRRIKIGELDGKEWLFKQEYPCTVQEAFQTSGNSLYEGEKIMDARASKVDDRTSPIVIGVDPARSGDRTVIVVRQGRTVREYKVYHEMDEMLLVGIISKLIRVYNPVYVNVDVAHGWGTIDRLNEMGHGRVVAGIHFGSKAVENDVFKNKRAEMYIHSRDWLHRGDCSIPDDDVFQIDLAAIPDYMGGGEALIRLVEKTKIKKDCGFSPDIADAFVLTFARSLRGFEKPDIHEATGDNANRKQTLQTLQRFRQQGKK